MEKEGRLEWRTRNLRAAVAEISKRVGLDGLSGVLGHQGCLRPHKPRAQSLTKLGQLLLLLVVTAVSNGFTLAFSSSSASSFWSLGKFNSLPEIYENLICGDYEIQCEPGVQAASAAVEAAANLDDPASYDILNFLGKLWLVALLSPHPRPSLNE